MPKAKILITRLLILITTWHVEHKTSYMCHLPQGEEKWKRVKTNQKNTEQTAWEEKPNLLLTKQFLWHSSLPVFVFLFFLRAIKFSILGIVGCFIDQAVGFVRSWLERGTSFCWLPGCPNYLDTWNLFLFFFPEHMPVKSSKPNSSENLCLNMQFSLLKTTWK